MREDLFRSTCRDVPSLAIFIDPVGQGLHTGIIHRDSEGDLHLLDLMFHEALRSARVRNKDFACVIPNADEFELHDLRAVCRQIQRRREDKENPDAWHNVPYAFRRASDTCIDPESGAFRLGSGLGLTCATFVLAVFEAASVPLVRVEQWQERADDQRRHEELLELMREYSVPEEHIERVAGELPCIRVRPEEVAGAGMADELPATFEEAQVAGVWLLDAIGVSRLE